jgi:tetratricopeptide (TPR) repeat protein
MNNFYVSSVGLFFGVSAWLFTRIDASARPKLWLTCFWVLFSLTAVGLIGQSRIRCRDWKNSGTLWLDALDKGYHSHLAYLSLGDYLARGGAIPKAIECFQKTIALKEDNADALNNLGISLTWLGQSAEGITYIRKALQIRPEFPGAYLNLGVAFQHAGKRNEAREAFEQAISQDPRNAEAFFQLGQELFLSGKTTEGKAHLRQALDLGFSKFPPGFFQQHPDLQSPRTAKRES